MRILKWPLTLGKSYYTDRFICDYFNDWDNYDGNMRQFLIVKRFNDESVKSAKEIENDFIKDFALAITSENWKELQNNLSKIKEKSVVIISHQRYIDLCLNDELRQEFCDGREVLIMDEKMNFPIYTFNDKYYIEIMALLPNELRPEYIKVCSKLNDILSGAQSQKILNQCIRVKPKVHKKTFDNFKNIINANLENYMIKKMDDRNKIRDFMEALELWYSQPCLYNAGNISTRNPKHKHWGLENNIILDASAGIDGIYGTNGTKYRVIKQQRIIDHSKCIFNFVNFNSSKTKMNEFSNDFFPEIAKKIKQNQKNGDTTLIVCHKDNAVKIKKQLLKLYSVEHIWMDKEDKKNDLPYSGEPIAISWYGNLIGKNEFKDFNKVWLIGIPNIPMEQYIVQTLSYKDKSHIGNIVLDIVGGRFKNDMLRSVQVGYIASEMYQSIKRIQRKPIPEGEFFIVCKDEEVNELIMSQVKGAKISKIIDMDFVKRLEEEKEQKKVENKKSDQVDQFIEYVSEFIATPKHKGTELKKHEIAKNLNISKMNRVLLDARVKALVITKKIAVHNKTIQIL